MRKDLDRYIDLKAKAKDIQEEIAELGAKIREESGLQNGQKTEFDGFTISFLPTRRYVMKPNRGKGLAGFIRRKYGEELCNKLMKFDYKDLGVLGKDVDEFFDCKESFVFRIKEPK